MALFPRTMETAARRAAGALPFVGGLARRYQRFNAEFVRRRKAYVACQRQHPRLYITAQLLYAVLCVGALVYTKTPPIIPLDLIFLLVFVSLTGRPFEFIRDWFAFVVLLGAYELLSEFGGALQARTNFSLAIHIDRILFFGYLPTNLLQEHLWNPAHLQWYDYTTTMLYAMHFGVPLLFGFVLWQWRKPLYWKFLISYMLLSFLAYVTFIIAPTAPPWMAANASRIPHVSRVLLTVLGQFAPISAAGASAVSVDTVAAMPSLHAAFPFLVWITAWKIWPRWGWSFVVYPIAIGFSIVYLGEHYFADALVGWLYAAAAYVVVWSDAAEPLRRSVIAAVSRAGARLVAGRKLLSRGAIGEGQ